MKRILFTSLLVLALQAQAGLTIGKPLPDITLPQSNGSSWHSNSLRGHKHLLIYMDPDKRKNVQPLLKALQASSRSLQTVAIVNLAATWMPNKILISKLKQNQSKMKNTTYLFDPKRMLVRAWGLADNDTEVLVLDRNNRVLYRKHGPLDSVSVNAILHHL
jgi:predicted transcriptional regulator